MSRLAIALTSAVIVIAIGLAWALAPGSGRGDVRVMYPSAFADLMTQWVGPAFERATGYRFLGEAGGSFAQARLIQDGIKSPDVFIAGDPSADRTLRGPDAHRAVSWWLDFGTSDLVVAWNPAGVFAPLFTQAAEQVTTIEAVLQEPGLRFCRADPDLDPEGSQTLAVLRFDEVRSGEAGFAAAVAGPRANKMQIFPGDLLGTRIQAGACDAAVMFEIEALGQGLPFVPMPRSVARAVPVTFTVTVPSTTIDAPGAIAFIQFLLGPGGRQLLTDQGFGPLGASPGGDAARVPASLLSLETTPTSTANGGAGGTG